MSKIKFTLFLSYLFISIICISILGCNDFKPPTKTIKFDAATKVLKSIKTEFNPVVASKNCDQSTTIRLHIPSPYPYDISKKMKWNNEGDSAHIVKIYLDSIEVQSIAIDNDFTIEKDSTEFMIGYKIIEGALPRFSKEFNDSGILTIELYSSEEKIADYHTQYHYLENNVPINLIRRRDLGFDRFSYEIEPKNQIIKELGHYMSDSEFTHKIVKHNDKYTSSYSVEGNGIYMRKSIKDKWKLAFDVPNLPELNSDIPLAFELEEKDYKYQPIAFSPLKKEDLGKNIVFNIFDDVLGLDLNVHFNDCELIIQNQKEVTIPKHVGWSVKK